VQRFDPRFFERGKAFAQLSPALCERLARFDDWPSVEDYNSFAEWGELTSPCALPEFCEQDLEAIKAAGGYEPFIEQERKVPTRARNWHDFFNALIWAHYPSFKWEAHRIQLFELTAGEIDPRNKRSLVQSHAAQFDEGGVVIVVDDPSWLSPVERLAWEEFFVDRRAAFERNIRCVVVGHALLEALLQPFCGITAKALPLVWPSRKLALPQGEQRLELDRAIAEELYPRLCDRRFLPLPILGVPGWCAGQDAAFYANTSYFRGVRRDA
jgi:hypothetical protein